MPLSQGQLINNRYRIVKLIAQGGFGAIYRGWDLSLSRPCAVKENLETSPEAQSQFIREATMLANLSHHNLPRVTDYFTLAGQGQYLVMDFVEGEDLQDMLERTGEPLPEQRVLPWIEQVCSALSYLHQQNPPIIHRDIKPANVKITPSGQAMLVDFGIAKLYDPLSKTTAGARAVTAGYSPVEQYGQGRTDARTDVYALGATLYTVLTGCVPPESTQRVVEDQLIPPQRLNPYISTEIISTITKALQIEPGKRFQSIADFNTSLKAPISHAVISETIKSTPDSTIPIVSSDDKRKLPWGWIGFAASLLVIILLILFFMSNRGAIFGKPSVTQTLTASLSLSSPVQSPTLLITPSPTSTAEQLPTLTSTQKPTDTREIRIATEPPTNTIKPATNTPIPFVGPAMFVIEVNSHCRGDDSTNADILRDLTSGASKEIIGINSQGNWFLIKIDDPATRKKICWINSSNGYVSGDQSQIPVCYWSGDGYTDNYRCENP